MDQDSDTVSRLLTVLLSVDSVQTVSGSGKIRETSFLSKCIHYTDRYISVNKMNARNQQSDSRVHSKPTQVLGFDPTQKALGLNPISIVPPLT